VIADEVMMLRAFRIKSRGAALDSYFAHQASLHEVAQIVINRSPGRARMDPVHSSEDLRSSRMPLVFHQERHDSVTLGRAPQAAGGQAPFHLRMAHEQV
jgi:hypothetical protein